jgi:hypothetical protein
MSDNAEISYVRCVHPLCFSVFSVNCLVSIILSNPERRRI